MSSARRLPSDGLDASGSWIRHRLRLLVGIALGETLTLAVMLANLLTLDDRTIAAVLGPVHGGLYLAGVLLTWTTPWRRLTKAVAVLPVVGVWLAVGQGRRPY